MTSINGGQDSTLQWGIELTPDVSPGTIAALAQRAEQAAIDAVFVSNHYNNRDSFVSLTQAAIATEEIRLGPGVVNPFEVHPVTLATAAATLNETSHGRAIFGIGAGDAATLSALGCTHERPVRRVHETIEVARALWAGESVSHDGTFSVDGARLSFETPPLPVFVGGQGPQMTRMAATYADGLLANGAHPIDYAWFREQVEQGVQRRANEAGSFTLAAFASVSIDTDRGRAIAAARAPVAFITAGSPQPVIERHGLDQTAVTAIREALASGDRGDAYGLVTEAMIDAFCVAGTPEEVTDRIAEIGRYTDAFVAASPLGPDRSTAIDLLGDVRKDLNERGVFQG